MAGKSWQTSHEPPDPRRRTGTRHTDKQWKKRRGRDGGGNQKLTGAKNHHTNAWLCLRSENDVCSVSTWRDTAGHGATLALFVVNSVELHLTTLNLKLPNHAQ